MIQKTKSHEKKIGHRDCSRWAHCELTVSSRWPKWSQPAVTEPWPGPWLSCDLAVTELWSYWRCRDWAVTEPWLSCDLAVTELWPCRDWAVTSPSRDWAVIIGPGAVVTVSSPWAHRELTVTIFFSWDVAKIHLSDWQFYLPRVIRQWDMSSHGILTLCGLMTLNGDIDLGQHWLR